jgi:hypothetical protein
MRGAILPLPQYVFMAWCLVKYRDNFTSFNINMDLLELGWKSVDWIHLAQERDKWLTLVNAIMNSWVP